MNSTPAEVSSLEDWDALFEDLEGAMGFVEISEIIARLTIVVLPRITTYPPVTDPPSRHAAVTLLYDQIRSFDLALRKKYEQLNSLNAVPGTPPKCSMARSEFKKVLQEVEVHLPITWQIEVLQELSQVVMDMLTTFYVTLDVHYGGGFACGLIARPSFLGMGGPRILDSLCAFTRVADANRLRNARGGSVGGWQVARMLDLEEEVNRRVATSVIWAISALEKGDSSRLNTAIDSIDAAAQFFNGPGTGQALYGGPVEQDSIRNVVQGIRNVYKETRIQPVQSCTSRRTFFVRVNKELVAVNLPPYERYWRETGSNWLVNDTDILLHDYVQWRDGAWEKSMFSVDCAHFKAFLARLRRQEASWNLIRLYGKTIYHLGRLAKTSSQYVAPILSACFVELLAGVSITQSGLGSRILEELARSISGGIAKIANCAVDDLVRMGQRLADVTVFQEWRPIDADNLTALILELANGAEHGADPMI